MTDSLARAMASLNSKRTGPFAYNTDIGLRRWRSAVAALKAGSSTIYNVCCLGDSITEGAQAGAGAGQGAASNWPSKGWVPRIRSAFTAKFQDCGTGMIPTYHPTGAPLWTFAGTGWTAQSGYGVTNSHQLSSAINDTATLSFSGTGIAVVIEQGVQGGTFSVTVDGAAPNNFSGYFNGAPSVKTVSVTGLANGAHTVVVKNTDATQSVYLLGAYPISAATGGFRVNMLGRYGTVAGDSTGLNVLPAEIDIWNPVLTIIPFLANDSVTPTSLATYEANLQTLVTRALTFGDVLMVSIGVITSNLATPQSTYVQLMKNVALTNNVAFLDLFNRWGGSGTYALNTLGLIATGSTNHPNDYGHQDIAAAVINVLLEDR